MNIIYILRIDNGDFRVNSLVFTLNISITMANTEFKFYFRIFHTYPQGTLSQIFQLGLSSHFMKKIGKLFVKILKIIF